jgi:hypothetical protein
MIRVKCCNNSEHIENFESPDYGDDLIEHQEQHRRLLGWGGGGWGSTIGLNFDILDTTAVVSPVDPSLCCHLTSSGTSIRCERDGVHLSREVYMDEASAIVEAVTGCGGVNVGDSASNGSDSSKRKHPDSVVTLPLSKRGRGSGSRPPVARWLRGEAEPHNSRCSGWGRGAGGSGRGFGGGGCRGGFWRTRAEGWPWMECLGRGHHW